RRWKSKRWPTKNIMKFIDTVYKNLPKYRIVLLGDEEASVEAERIETFLYPRPINLCGKTTLADLPHVIKQLKVFVTPDTATLHLAQALDVPTIGLFGPTSPARHTVKSKNLTVFCKKLDCSFCYSPRCKLREKYACMEKIDPEEVFSKVNEIVRQ
ncbi:MAG: glycosyltransferase family 9 protein, partial [Candidatus Omnitrophota bacterium]